MSTRVVKLSVINDLTCPNCAVGQYELFTAISHCTEELRLPLEFQLEFLPYRLISTSVLPLDYQPKITKADFFSNKFGAEKFAQFQESIDKWAKEKGVPISFRGVVSQSTRAHRLSRKAFLMGGMEMQLPVLMTIFRVHLEEGKDVADINVLADVAAELNLMTKDQAVAFLESNELEEEINNMCDDALAKGITGVPLILIDGRWGVSGGQSSEVFVQIFKKLANATPASPLPPFATPLAQPQASALVV